MFKGDSLTVIALLLGIAAGAFMTGYTAKGVERRNLYVVGGLFIILTVAWVVLPTGALGTAAQIAQRLIALMPVVIVGFVAVLISSMRRSIEAADPQPEPQQADKPAVAELHPARQREILLKTISMRVATVRYDAKQAIANRASAAPSVVANMESLFATFRSNFGVLTPDCPGPDREKLQHFVAYLDAVWPFIRDGNYEDAQQRAQRFVAETDGGRIVEQ
jgi:hypothetical protein